MRYISLYWNKIVPVLRDQNPTDHLWGELEHRLHPRPHHLLQHVKASENLELIITVDVELIYNTMFNKHIRVGRSGVHILLLVKNVVTE